MNRESNSKTSLFLMELIISILFFSITGAVCVKLFVNAHVIAQHSVALTNAVMWAQNCSEAYTGCDGNLNDLSAIYPDCCVLVNEETPQKGTLLIFLDKNWKRSYTWPILLRTSLRFTFWYIHITRTRLNFQTYIFYPKGGVGLSHLFKN